MKKNSAKVIAIVGGPRSGKTFLTEILDNHYKAKTIFEKENFPERIKIDIEKNIRPLERILWFRNSLVNRFIKAINYKKKGETVVMDTFWISYKLHIDALIKGFKNKIISEVAEIDQKLLKFPDVIILLKAKEKTVKNFIKLGKRSFDNTKNFYKDQAEPINKLHDDFFNKNKHLPSKVIKLQRDNLDFKKQKDLQEIINLIEN